MTEIDRALADKRLLGAALGPLETWRTWLIILKAAFGRPLDVKERKVFRAIAGKRGLPKHRVRELWCIAGRRSGKSGWLPRSRSSSGYSRSIGSRLASAA